MYFGAVCGAVFRDTQNLLYWWETSGVCKYYIGPIGDLSLLTATAATAARLHSLH